MQSRYGAWDLVRTAGQMASKGARAISPLARTTVPVGRGLWRLGWALWMLAAVPVIFIAHHESIEIMDWVAVPAQREFDPLQHGATPVPEPKTHLDAQGNPIPNSPEDWGASDPIIRERPIRRWDAQGNPVEREYSDMPPGSVVISTVQTRANLPKLFLYSTLGLTGT